MHPLLMACSDSSAGWLGVECFLAFGPFASEAAGSCLALSRFCLVFAWFLAAFNVRPSPAKNCRSSM